MEGKLIKLGLSEGYRLDDLNGNYIASTLNGKNKLSLKNCEAVENGYDLDELAENTFSITPSNELHHQIRNQSFKIGFQKAVEILGDKKFSEFLDKEKELGISDIKTIERIQWYYKTYFDKSQQTEWDVFFNPDEKDSEGCLILKRL